VIFQTDYDEIKLKKSYGVILVTSSLLRHRKRHQTNVTRFFILGPSQLKIFRLRQRDR